MMLIIHGLPRNAKYVDLKSLIVQECNISEFILDNLVTDNNGLKKVRIGVADEAEGSILMHSLDGYCFSGHQIKVHPVGKVPTTAPREAVYENRAAEYGNRQVAAAPSRAGYGAPNLAPPSAYPYTQPSQATSYPPQMNKMREENRGYPPREVIPASRFPTPHGPHGYTPKNTTPSVIEVQTALNPTRRPDHRSLRSVEIVDRPLYGAPTSGYSTQGPSQGYGATAVHDKTVNAPYRDNYQGYNAPAFEPPRAQQPPYYESREARPSQWQQQPNPQPSKPGFAKPAYSEAYANDRKAHFSADGKVEGRGLQKPSEVRKPMKPQTGRRMPSRSPPRRSPPRRSSPQARRLSPQARRSSPLLRRSSPPMRRASPPRGSSPKYLPRHNQSDKHLEKYEAVPQQPGYSQAKGYPPKQAQSHTPYSGASYSLNTGETAYGAPPVKHSVPEGRLLPWPPGQGPYSAKANNVQRNQPPLQHPQFDPKRAVPFRRLSPDQMKRSQPVARRSRSPHGTKSRSPPRDRPFQTHDRRGSRSPVERGLTVSWSSRQLRREHSPVFDDAPPPPQLGVSWPAYGKDNRSARDERSPPQQIVDRPDEPRRRKYQEGREGARNTSNLPAWERPVPQESRPYPNREFNPPNPEDRSRMPRYNEIQDAVQPRRALMQSPPRGNIPPRNSMHSPPRGSSPPRSKLARRTTMSPARGNNPPRYSMASPPRGNIPPHRAANSPPRVKPPPRRPMNSPPQGNEPLRHVMDSPPGNVPPRYAQRSPLPRVKPQRHSDVSPQRPNRPTQRVWHPREVEEPSPPPSYRRGGGKFERNFEEPLYHKTPKLELSEEDHARRMEAAFAIAKQLVNRNVANLANEYINPSKIINEIRKRIAERVDNVMEEQFGFSLNDIIFKYRLKFNWKSDQKILSEVLESFPKDARIILEERKKKRPAAQESPEAPAAKQMKKTPPKANPAVPKQTSALVKKGAMAAAVQKILCAEDGHYELCPLLNNALKRELDLMMALVLQELPNVPGTDAENLVVSRFKNKAADELRTILAQNVTKRMLNINTKLIVKIRFDPEPKKSTLTAFLSKYRVVQYKKVLGSIWHLAVLPGFSFFDSICSLPEKFIFSGVEVTVKPYYPSLNVSPPATRPQTSVVKDETPATAVQVKTEDKNVKSIAKEPVKKTEVKEEDKVTKIAVENKETQKVTNPKAALEKKAIVKVNAKTEVLKVAPKAAVKVVSKVNKIIKASKTAQPNKKKTPSKKVANDKKSFNDGNDNGDTNEMHKEMNMRDAIVLDEVGSEDEGAD